MPCWARPTGRCCAGSRCSRPRSPRPRRKPCWPAGRRPTATSSRPRWPGSPSRASWSRSRTCQKPGTARWRPSASTGPPSWPGTAKPIRLRPGTWAGAWTPSAASGWCRATTGPGGGRSIRWPTSCAPRCAGRRLTPSDGRKRTGWRSRWPSCASRAVFPASPSGGTSRPRGSRRMPATRPPRCAAPRARPSPGTSATTRSGCSRRRPTRPSGRVSRPARPRTWPRRPRCWAALWG